MANEKRLIDANEAYEIARSSGLHNDFGKCMADLTSLKELLEDCTTADAVEVVRCKDCKHGCEDHEDAYLCNNAYYGLIGFTRGEDFCSYGERRTKDDHHRTE